MMQEPTADPMLEAALMYARLGFHVLPLTGTRIPFSKPGVHAASKHEPDVLEFWAQHPGANIGIACGNPKKSQLNFKLCVVDVDPRNGGALSWTALLEKYGPIPLTIHARTGRGGDHFYFLVPSSLRIGKGIAAGVDTKGDGGYVVAPPSSHEKGENYVWATDPETTTIARAPQWILDLIASSTAKQPHASESVADAFVEGGRDNALVSLAGSMRRRGMVGDEIYGALSVVNVNRCKPTLEDSDVRRISYGVERYEITDAVVPNSGPRKLEDVFAAMRGQGPPTRFVTGISALDTAMRGGMVTPRLVAIGGEPSTGKTTLLTQWAIRAALAGRRVFFMAVDESDEGIAFRVAQHFGCDIEKLENNDQDEIDRAYTMTSKLGISVVDSGTIENAVSVWSPRPHDVVVFDSLQTVSCEAGLRAESPRARVEANMMAIKRVRMERKTLTFCTSEVSRGFYRNREQASELNPMAAFKESGNIEYAIETGLVLLSVAGDETSTDVLVAKNRRYPRKPFRLMLDRVKCVFSETDRPDLDEVTQFDIRRRKILDVVRTFKLRSANDIWRKAKGGRGQVLKDVREMLKEGILIEVDGLIRGGTTGTSTGT